MVGIWKIVYTFAADSLARKTQKKIGKTRKCSGEGNLTNSSI